MQAYAEGEGDGYISDGEGGVGARDMDDLEQIFAERRAAAASGGASGGASAAAAAAAKERDAYIPGRDAKERRQVDGLKVYTEKEMEKMALSDVRGKLDGPCPFECSCCF